MATVLVSVSAETTFTASYSNVSANCTVTVPTYLFYDDCSSASGISQYGNSILLKGTSTNNLTFSTDHYIMSGTNADFSGFAIPNCTGVDNVKVRIKFKLTQTSNAAYNQFGVCVCDSSTPSTNMGCRARNDKKFQTVYNTDQGENTIYTPTGYFSSEYYYVELIKQGTSLTINLYDKNLTQLVTNTRTVSNYSNPQYIFYNLTVRGTSYATHIQEILVESL